MGYIAQVPLCLLVYGPGVLDAYQRFRLRDVFQVDDAGIILLVALYHIVQYLLELLLTDARSLAYRSLDFLEVNAVRPQRLDVLHRNLVQLVPQL